MGEISKNVSDEEKLEADARNSLLAHFSSKSTNETTVLIGLAVVFFADIQAYSAFNLPLIWQKITFLALTLGIIAFFVIRQLSRLICWGQLATAVGIAEMKSVDETTTWLKETCPKPIRVKLAPTYLARLNFSSNHRFYDCREQLETLPRWDRLPLLIFQLTSKKWFIWASIVAVLAIWIASLLVAYFFFSLF